MKIPGPGSADDPSSVPSEPFPGLPEQHQEHSLEVVLTSFKITEVEDLELEGYVFDETCLHVAE